MVAEVCYAPAGWRVARAAELVTTAFRVFFQLRLPLQCFYRARPAGTSSLEAECTGAGMTADWQTVDPRDGGVVHVAQFDGHLAGGGTAATLRGQMTEYLNLVPRWSRTTFFI